MLRHAARGVPWALVGGASLLIVGLFVALRVDPWTLWPLQATGVGLLAGAVGWCLDEPAAAVVDPAPRGLAWRTCARTAGVLALLTSWAVGVWWARAHVFGHPWAVLGQGVVAALIAIAWVTWCRARGEATPGQRWAISIIPATTAWALIRPFTHQFPVFPYAVGGRYGDWTTSSLDWSMAGLVAGATIMLLLTHEGRPWERFVR